LVVEMSPWSSKLMVGHPFFCLKNGHLKATVNVHRCKTWFARFDVFCYDSAASTVLPSLWHIKQSPLAYNDGSAAICQWSHSHGVNFQQSSSCFLHKLPQACGQFSAALAVRAMVVWPLAYCSRRGNNVIYEWISSQVIAKSAKSEEPVFTSMDVLLYGS
jgi:hypothetical protein